MSSPVQGKRRMDTDVIKLIESKHEVRVKRLRICAIDGKRFRVHRSQSSVGLTSSA